MSVRLRGDSLIMQCQTVETRTGLNASITFNLLQRTFPVLNMQENDGESPADVAGLSQLSSHKLSWPSGI